MYTWSRTLLLLALLFVVISMLPVSCSIDKEPAGSVVEHPLPNLIAYHDRDHILIKKDQSFEELSNPSKGLIQLKNYLENPDIWRTEQFGVTVNDASSLKMTAIGHDRFLILDTGKDQLIEYNFLESRDELVAGFGRGPGELQHSIDLEYTGDYLYVARRDMRLSRFKCEFSKCIYDKTILLDFQPISVASTKSGLAMTTGVIIGRDDIVEKNSYIHFPAVILIDRLDGHIIGEFGKIYDTRHLMVLAVFSRSGFVSYITELERYIYVNSWFPFVYVYDDDFKLEETYKLENYIQNKFEFFPKKKRRRFPIREHTLISEIKAMENGHILLVTTTQKNQQLELGDTVYDYTYDYYVIDHMNRKVIFLGTEEKTSNYRSMVLPVQNALIKNDGGVLYRLIKY
ncbi:MAG: hypothetical protein ACFCU6_00120 [Balneolaceae bacterium]